MGTVHFVNWIAQPADGQLRNHNLNGSQTNKMMRILHKASDQEPNDEMLSQLMVGPKTVTETWTHEGAVIEFRFEAFEQAPNYKMLLAVSLQTS